MDIIVCLDFSFLGVELNRPTRDHNCPLSGEKIPLHNDFFIFIRIFFKNQKSVFLAVACCFEKKNSEDSFLDSI